MNPTEQIPTAAAIDRIDTLAASYSNVRKLVATRLTHLQEEQRISHKRLIGGIKSAVAEAKDIQAKLTAAIDERRDLFVQPRTWTLHGIKLGLRKGSGKMKWPKVEALLALIKKNFSPATCEGLIKQVEQPNKDALKELPALVLKKLGVEIEGTGDCVFVKPTDGEVDKLVEHLLGEGSMEETETEG